jgi:adenylate cyclase
LASRAVAHGKDDGNVFWMAAFAVLRLQGDAQRAKDLAYRSLQLNPNSAIGLAMAGRTELHTGNASKALELLFRAERLSPREPREWFIMIGIAGACLRAGRFHEAISACRKALNQKPGNSMVLRMLAASLVKQGRQSEAAQVAREVLAVDPQVTLTKLRARGGYMDINFANEYLAALRVAGIPE